MKHGHFTTGDIFEAMQSAGLIGTVYDFRQFLNALPDPATDDWQECRFEDIQKGDRFKVEHADWSYEGQVKWIDAEVICYDPRIGLAITPQNIDDMRGITLYRIPGTQHPDPAEHPVILVHEACDLLFDPPLGMIWDASEHYESPSHRMRPENITRFTPAKVVEDDR